MHSTPISVHRPAPSQRTRLARLGDWMADHRRAILAIQWLIVAFYLVLVTLPAFLPHPHPEARLFSADFGASTAVDPNLCTTAARTPSDKLAYVACWQDRLVLLAQYLFWGLWWPFAILSIMLFGRLWCGVLCPEGALTEFASRHGRGGAIPKWLRWSGWPVVAFIATTVYGQLISVYDYPQAALLILGGSTIAAAAVGWLYGRGKRVWCRYLCPVSGVFNLLARVAPLHFRIDRAVWDSHPQRRTGVDCAPLLDVKHMKGAGACHACGRCSGHLDAVTLTLRSPNAEILGTAADTEKPRTSDAVLLLFGMLGVAIGAFHWTVNPWFVRGKQVAADWLVAHEVFWPLTESPAWWLLTRYPAAGDVFSWLDGAAILVWIAAHALILGGFCWIAALAAARLAGLDWRRLALCLIPLAGIGLFLGLSMMTATHLRAEGVYLGWLPTLRGGLLAIGLGWSAWLGAQLIGSQTNAFGQAGNARRWLAGLVWLLPQIAVGGSWWLVFFVRHME